MFTCAAFLPFGRIWLSTIFQFRMHFTKKLIFLWKPLCLQKGSSKHVTSDVTLFEKANVSCQDVDILVFRPCLVGLLINYKRSWLNFITLEWLKVIAQNLQSKVETDTCCLLGLRIQDNHSEAKNKQKNAKEERPCNSGSGHFLVVRVAN